MPKRTTKATALILAFLLLAANLMAELSHQDFLHSAPHGPKTALVLLQTELPKLDRSQKLCLACLFANGHHGFPANISFAVTLPLPSPITLLTLHFFSQFNKTSRKNRAPPLAEWMIS